ncbi:uncharacterized protein [Miscanthus floridulus]|uniref:uncharacterized protein n=1 Tax=Miscanthus floridulus TaxID=154761 RepID=UPI003459DC07
MAPSPLNICRGAFLLLHLALAAPARATAPARPSRAPPAHAAPARARAAPARAEPSPRPPAPRRTAAAAPAAEPAPSPRRIVSAAPTAEPAPSPRRAAAAAPSPEPAPRRRALAPLPVVGCSAAPPRPLPPSSPMVSTGSLGLAPPCPLHRRPRPALPPSTAGLASPRLPRPSSRSRRTERRAPHDRRAPPRARIFALTYARRPSTQKVTVMT